MEKLRKMRKRNKHWYYLRSKDRKCQGYQDAETVDKACLIFGYPPNECSKIEEVVWDNDKGFVPKKNKPLIPKNKQLKLIN